MSINKIIQPKFQVRIKALIVPVSLKPWLNPSRPTLDLYFAPATLPLLWSGVLYPLFCSSEPLPSILLRKASNPLKTRVSKSEIWKLQFKIANPRTHIKPLSFKIHQDSSFLLHHKLLWGFQSLNLWAKAWLKCLLPPVHHNLDSSHWVRPSVWWYSFFLLV